MKGLRRNAAAYSRGGIERIAKINVSRTKLIVIFDVIQVSAARARVLERHHGVGHKLLIDGEAPELGLRGADVLVYVAKAGGRQRLRTTGALKRAGIRVRHRGILYLNHRVVRRVLDDIEGDVAVVALIRDAVAAAQ